MSNKTGGFFGFIKRLFGIGNNADRKSQTSGVSNEDFDEDLAESYKYDEEKARREAEEMIEQSFEEEKINPDDPSVFFQRATGYSILDDNETALSLLDKVLSIDADYIDAYRLKATIYEESENYEEVVNYLNRAISLHSVKTDASSEFLPQNVNDLLLNFEISEKAGDFQKRGAAHFNLNNHEAAIVDFSKAIEIDSNNDFLYSSRGEVYLEMGNAEKALQDLNKAIAIEEHEFNYANRAGIYKHLGDLDAALRDISKAIALNEANNSESAQYFDGHLDRAEIYMEKGDFDSAVQDFTVQIEKDPSFIDPYERRAAAYRSLGMESLAQSDEQKAAELSAENEESEKSL